LGGDREVVGAILVAAVIVAVIVVVFACGIGVVAGWRFVAFVFVVAAAVAEIGGIVAVVAFVVVLVVEFLYLVWQAVNDIHYLKVEW